MAGVALGDIHLRFTWQAWRLVTSTFVLRGRRGTWRHLPAFGVAGVALVALGGALGRRWSPRAPCHFEWQAWCFVGRSWFWKLQVVSGLMELTNRYKLT